MPAPAWAIVELRHAHGIGYSADGSRIFVPNHHGIAVYSEGRWSKIAGSVHDYMGFVVTRQFVFSSGHLAGSRGRANPLGLMRSGDGGQSWTALALAGEAEFHLVAAGYLSNTVYVYSPEPNSAMPRPGLYRLMMGKRLVGWRAAAARGLAGDVGMLTAHPSEPATLAAATTAGLYLSRDGGDEFHPIDTASRATAARFTLDGDALLVGSLNAKPGLFRVALKDGRREALALPPFGRDAVANIAQNPVRRAELALISFERAVFVSSDAGKTWRRIARPRGTPPGRN